MEHKLRVIIKLEIDHASATVQITGCLTPQGCKALLPLIIRAQGLSGSLAVQIDLSHARHIDAEALHSLEAYSLTGTVAADPQLRITMPAHLPTCPALKHSLDVL
ncbi:hypothetical protein [Arthrobacter sp. Bz4]|uniref:hypothetical protein n=1 Tax=Arthrobacter sp. Bz4 TaxID=2171979 RepID=UPI000D520C2F|nr:hypothetical protein [Arthrobacter sp. Bz4]PVE16946.1 hypothetical protein DDA93_11165 [Arthrobacter sp. Bz4]